MCWWKGHLSYSEGFYGHSVRCAGDKYALVMKFVDHVFDDQVIDHLTLRIILPEGATYVILSVDTSKSVSK